MHQEPPVSPTVDGQIVNLILAAWRWSEVEPSEVVHGLALWRCGTQACFGGHLMRWPEFIGQGVRSDPFDSDYPTMPEFGIAYCGHVAERLFGDPYLFEVRRANRDDRDMTGASDWEVVRNRIEAQFERLTA